jgi:hypothetical protein
MSQVNEPPATSSYRQLLELRVLRFGFLQDENVGVGVFPEREKIFVGSAGPNASRIGIGSKGGTRAPESDRLSRSQT